MKINEVRAQIDDIDDQLVDLFLQRLQLCRIIGDIKRKKNMPIFNSIREQEILNRVSKKDPYNSHYISQLFNQIFSICKDVQAK